MGAVICALRTYPGMGIAEINFGRDGTSGSVLHNYIIFTPLKEKSKPENLNLSKRAKDAFHIPVTYQEACPLEGQEEIKSY